ncbi:saccharopine dehydrogenase family protein [Psychromonas hadalis]|uniref:saccharopine dehydrogenase family protein n=1 Tax=Psychromonas hadalis TaxID=211669 RepID=UPI0003B40D39|nr:saccharopine dehydrogenase C-terminal domain-containing protein [Psychromonas hadalis]
MIKRVLVLGLGRIGSQIACLLNTNKNYHVIGADIDEKSVQKYARFFSTMRLTNDDYSTLFSDIDVVFSALSFNENPKVALAALNAGASYFDLTEDVRCTEQIKQIAKRAKTGQFFMPQCGLAPGFIGILAYSFRHHFEKLDSLKLRVGALPQFPSNQMMYNLTWSTAGLVNEYANPCEAIKDYQRTFIEPLEGREVLTISGVKYEAFNTSGGVANLCISLQKQVRELTYKTIRYPGHCQLMRFLFRDLRLGEEGTRRNMLMNILDSAVATTEQDIVLISVVATGYNADKLQQISRTFLIPHSSQQSAIQIATANAAVTTLDCVLQDKMLHTGFVEQEILDIDTFLKNQFAKPYRDAELSR